MYRTEKERKRIKVEAKKNDVIKIYSLANIHTNTQKVQILNNKILLLRGEPFHQPFLFSLKEPLYCFDSHSSNHLCIVGCSKLEQPAVANNIKSPTIKMKEESN